MQDKHIDDDFEAHIHMLGCQAMTEARNLGYAEGRGWKEDDYDLLDMIDKHEELLTKAVESEQLAILEGLKRESRELIEFNKTEPLNVGEIQNVELIRAVPIEAIQQQIDSIKQEDK